MFSLIITIVAIALVAALALATIYYGGTAFNKGAATAAATRAISQGQQIQGAMDLFRADFTRWPTKEEMLGANEKGFVYLRSWPENTVKTAALGGSSAVAQAVAQAASEASTGAAAGNTWRVPTNPVQPTAVLSDSVSQEVCAQINLLSRGDNGIANVVSTSYATQCFSPDEVKFVVVVTKAGYTDLNTGLNPGGTNPPQVVVTDTPLKTDNPADPQWVRPPDTTSNSNGGGTPPAGAASLSVTPYRTGTAVSGNAASGFDITVSGDELFATFVGAAYPFQPFGEITYKITNTGAAGVALTFPDSAGPELVLAAPAGGKVLAGPALAGTMIGGYLPYLGNQQIWDQAAPPPFGPTFSVVPPCSSQQSLSPGQSCAFFAAPPMLQENGSVCFGPAPGTTFTANGQPVRVSVDANSRQCSGVAIAPPQLSVNNVPATVSVPAGGISAVRGSLGAMAASLAADASVTADLLIVTITNPGDAPLRQLAVGYVTPLDGTAPAFTAVPTGYSNPCPGLTGGSSSDVVALLPARSSCNVAFGYAPGTGQNGASSVGFYAYSMVSGGGQPIPFEKVALTVSNDGIAGLKFSTTAITFANIQKAGAYSEAELTQPIVITNRRYSPVAFDMSSSGTHPVDAHFTVTSSCGTSIPARGICTIAVKVKNYAAETPGSYSSQITFADGGGIHNGLPLAVDVNLGISGIGNVCAGTDC